MVGGSSRLLKHKSFSSLILGYQKPYCFEVAFIENAVVSRTTSIKIDFLVPPQGLQIQLYPSIRTRMQHNQLVSNMIPYLASSHPWSVPFFPSWIVIEIGLSRRKRFFIHMQLGNGLNDIFPSYNAYAFSLQ